MWPSVRNSVTALLAFSLLASDGKEQPEKCISAYATGMVGENVLNDKAIRIAKQVCIEKTDALTNAVQVSDPKDRSKTLVVSASDLFADRESANRFYEKAEKGALPTKLDAVCAAPVLSGKETAETGTSSGKVPLSSLPMQKLGTITETAEAIEFESTSGFVQKSEALLKSIQKKEAEDHRRVETAFLELAADPGALAAGLERAEKRAAEAVADLDAAKEVNLLPGEVIRHRNLFDDVRSLSAQLRKDLGTSNGARQLMGALTPFANLVRHASGRTSPKERHRSPSRAPASASREDLVSRSLMLNALPPGVREAMVRELNHTVALKLTLPNGRTARTQEVSGWYRLGPSDCSAFVSQVLFKHRVYTLDLRAIYGFKRTGAFPKPPIYAGKRLRVLKEVAEDLLPVDVYEGDNLRPGDLLGTFVAWEQRGHVMQVVDYDPITKRVTVIDATQGTGTASRRDFNLSVHPLSARHRPLRPGFFALRPLDTRKCGQPLRRDL